MEIKKIIELTVVIIGLFVNVRAEFHNITMSNFTHIMDGSFFQPTVLKVKNQLVFVSYPKVNSELYINLESKVIPNNGICNITIPEPEDSDFLSPIAKFLGNGKLLVTLVETNPEQDSKDIFDNTESGVRFYIIDLLKNCVTSRFMFTIPFDNRILESNKPLKIIPYQDTFDIFVKSYTHCKPAGSLCILRFNDEGDSLGTTNFDFDTSEKNFDLEEIYPIKEFDGSDGYVYISNNNSTLRILNSKFKILKERKLEGYIVAQSILNDDIAICFYIDDVVPRTDCLKIDRRLKIISRVSLSNSYFFLGRRVYNLLDGSSLVVLLSRGKINSHVRRWSIDGKLSGSEIYRFECKSLTTDPQDYFVELKGGVYCFSFICQFRTVTYCTSLPEANKLSSYL